MFLKSSATTAILSFSLLLLFFFSILFFSYKVLLNACLRTLINTFIINILNRIFGYIFIITFFNRIFHAFCTVFLIVCFVIRFFICCHQHSRSDYFFSYLPSLFLAASSAFGICLTRFALSPARTGFPANVTGCAGSGLPMQKPCALTLMKGYRRTFALSRRTMMQNNP